MDVCVSVSVFAWFSFDSQLPCSLVGTPPPPFFFDLFVLLQQTGMVISDVESVRRVFNTKQRNYDKDLELSYSSFLDLLGNGLVTSSGALWNKQRTLLGHALRVEILEDTAVCAQALAPLCLRVSVCVCVCVSLLVCDVCPCVHRQGLTLESRGFVLLHLLCITVLTLLLPPPFLLPPHPFFPLARLQPVAKRAIDRLSEKLQQHVESGKPIEMAEEFRVLTLQVIGELILTLTPEESARVFPDLYLPIVDEANLRIWAPWRKYLFWTAEQRHYRCVCVCVCVCLSVCLSVCLCASVCASV